MAVDLVDAAGAVRRAYVTIPAEPHSVVEVPLDAAAAPARVVLDGDVGVLGTVAERSVAP
jgi:hypothetical protein